MKSEAETSSQSTTGATVRDPVCGMNIDPGVAAGTYEYRGQTYYFCALTCLSKFKQNPAKYLGGAKPAPLSQPSSAAYVCPMDPEVREPGPGACPKCGMALEPEVAGPPAQVTEYYCPMHPEVVSREPGSCPKCGMALEPRVVAAAEERNPELEDMTRRFWVGVVITIPLLAIAMSDLVPHRPIQRLIPAMWLPWIEFAMATPVVLWAGWPFLVRGWR